MQSARTFARRSLVLAACVATVLTMVPGGNAAAAPSPADIDRSIKTLGAKLDAVNEQYNEAFELLKQSRAKQATLTAQIKTFEVKTSAYEAKVGDIGAAAFRGGRPGMANVMLSGGSPETVLEQMAMLDIVTRDQRTSIDALLAAKKPLDDAKRKLDAEVANQAAQEKKLRDTKTILNRDIAKLKSQLPRSSRSGDRAPVYDGPAQGRARVVVEFAHAQVGKPYVFGADGPGSYDCSGLTMASWRKVGISLPHSAKQQYAQEPKVSKSALQPGDIVFFYSPISHNGVYIGNGKVIHAPEPGDNVKIANMSVMPYSGAVRPS